MRTFGFPAQAPSGGHPGTARMGQPFTADGGVTLLGLTDANALAQGFSGGPVLDRDGFVVAMVTALPGADRCGRGADLAYATPTSVLQQIGPGLQAHRECPYPGLAPFIPEQARWYHGRTRTVAALLDRIRDHSGVVGVFGPSGSGRSSLVAAGLLPGLTGDRIRLLRAGTDPTAVIDAVTAAATATRPRLVIIDQFEELLTTRTRPGRDPRAAQPAAERSGRPGPGRAGADQYR